MARAVAWSSMQRDFKIGLILGLGLLSVAFLIIATRGNLSPQARLAREHVVRYSPQQPGPSTPLQPSATPVREPNIAAVAAQPQPPLAETPPYAPTAPREEVRIKADRFHIVVPDDTLWGIAEQYLGSSQRWGEIFELNRDIVSNPQKIRPGMKLILPD